MKEFFHNNGIHSTTIQAEFVEIDGVPSSPHGFKKCVLDCPTDDSTGEKQDSCLASVCCPEPKNRNKKKRHHSWSHDDPNDKLRRNSFKFDGNQILHQNGHFKLGHGDNANSQLINRCGHSVLILIYASQRVIVIIKTMMFRYRSILPLERFEDPSYFQLLHCLCNRQFFLNVNQADLNKM